MTKALLLWGVVVVLSLPSSARAAHEATEAVGRPKFDGGCTVYPTGKQHHYTTFAFGALSPDGDKAFVANQTDTPMIETESGEEKRLSLDGRVSYSAFSPDGKKLLTAVTGRGVKVWEASSGKASGEALHDAPVTLAKFSPDSKFVASASTDGTYRIMNARTGKTAARGKHGKPLSSLEFSADGKKLVTGSRDGTVHVVDAASGESQTYTFGAEVNGASLSDDGRFLIAGSRDNTAKIINLENGDEKIVKHDGWVLGGAISPDGRYAVTASADGTAKVVEVATGNEVHRIKHQKEVSKVKFSPDGKFIVTASMDGTAKIVGVPGWNEHGSVKHTNRINDLAISPDGRFVATGSRDGLAKVADLASGKEVASVKLGGFIDKVGFSKDGKKLLAGNRRKLVASDLDLVCVNDGMGYRRAARPDEGAASHQEILDDLCPKEFKAEDWRDFTPPQYQGKILPSSLAKNFLYRFQKPGGFDPREHAQVFVTIMKSDMPLREPGLVAGALQNAAAVSPQFYDTLFEKIPALRDLKADPKAEPVCRTEKDQEQIAKGSKAYLDNLLHKHELSPTVLADWAGLSPLQAQLSKLSEKDKEHYLGELSESMAHGATYNPQIADIFHSKLYYYSEEAAKPFFGLEKDPLRTEVATVREHDKIRVMLFGTQPIDGDASTLTPHGFYVKPIGQVPLRQGLPTGELDMKKLGFNPDVAWSHAGKKFTGNLKAEVKASIADIIPKGKTYPYEELWADDKLTGLVFTGSNLRDLSAGALESYVGYYQERGYEFGEKQDIANLPQFMKEKISSGDVDYMVKEAHSGGDEKNLVEIDREARYMVGTKELPNGKKEEIILVYPKEGKQATTYIGNDEFGEWIRAREKDKGSLVYLNASCWSCQKALFEIEAASSPKLVDVATTTISYVFANRKEHPQRIVMDSFLDGKSYQQTRDALMVDDGYRSGKTDVYIFPDEETYDNVITKKLKIPVAMTVKMAREDGTPHHPGQGH